MRVNTWKRSRKRNGATMVEAAIVLPIFFMFIIGMVLVGQGIYYYNLTADLARQGTRYATVHGNDYYTDSGTNMLVSDIYNNSIKPATVGLNTSNLSYSFKFGTYVTGSWVWTTISSASYWSSSAPPTSSNPNSTPSGLSLTNAVKVTVTYTWSPFVYKVGTLNMTSTGTSVMPMSY